MNDSGQLPARGPLRLALLVPALATVAVLLTSPLAAASDPLVPPVSTTGNPPSCRVADRTTNFTRTADWSRTLLDWTFRVPATYRPPNLVSVSRAGISGGGYVRAEVIPDLKAMAAAARRAGAPLAVQSAYRSYATQVSTFRQWVGRLGYSVALVGSARAGHSEHQLGTSIDFKSYGGGVPWSFGGYDWATSRPGRWMLANAWKYGFVLSYPRGKRTQVCYGYEPWHYRYYGRTVARAIHDSGLAPRVWLWRHAGLAATPTPPAATPSPTPTPTPTDSSPPEPTPTDPSTPTSSPTQAPSEMP